MACRRVRYTATFGTPQRFSPPGNLTNFIPFRGPGGSVCGKDALAALDAPHLLVATNDITFPPPCTYSPTAPLASGFGLGLGGGVFLGMSAIGDAGVRWWGEGGLGLGLGAFFGGPGWGGLLFGGLVGLLVVHGQVRKRSGGVGGKRGGGGGIR